MKKESIEKKIAIIIFWITLPIWIIPVFIWKIGDACSKVIELIDYYYDKIENEKK